MLSHFCLLPFAFCLRYDEPGLITGRIMHIESLKVFCDLVDTRSFSKAAAMNFISQSAVSQQVRAFEEKYNRQLIERSRKGLVPTAAGLAVYKGFREILECYHTLDEELKDLSHVVSGRVRVVTIYSVGLHELSRVMKRFITAYPQVNIHIEYSRNNKIYDDVINGASDFGIVAYPSSRPQIEILPFRDDRLALICHPKHPFAQRKKIDIGQLNGERLIGFERDIPTRKAIDKILRQHDISPDYLMEFDNVETMKQFVEAGIGITILPRTTVENEIRKGDLCAVNFTQSYMRPIGVIHRKGKIFSLAARKFLDLLTEEHGRPS
jgi:LysR family transcriptional regulator, transcriptional activator of the cysJI operon